MKVDSKFSCFCVLFAMLVLVILHGGTLIGPQVLAVSIIAMLCISFALFTDFSEIKNQVYWIIPWLVITLIIGLQLVPFKEFNIEQTDPFALKNRISAMPLETISYWVLFSFYWIVAWIVSNLRQERIILLISVLGLLLLFEALYGIVAYINNHEKILGIWSVKNYSRTVSGTFVNRNHFAAIFEVGIPVVFSLLAMKGTDQKFNWSVRLSIGLLMLIICALAVLNSNSRLGLICFLIAIFVWSILISLKLGFAEGPKKYILLLILIMFVFLLVGLWYGLEPIMNRFQSAGEDRRYQYWVTAIKSFPSTYWLWGMGAGTLVDNFRLIAPAELAHQTVYQLHNDWLEFILDFGIFGSLAICLSFLFWFKKLHPQKFSLLQVGAISGIVAIAIHSLGDFCLQIPGVAVLFWIMVGILMNRKLVRFRDN